MAVIYLRHPLHGEKVACGDLEASMDRANGWLDFDPTNREPEPVAPVVIEEPVPAFVAFDGPGAQPFTIVAVSEDVPTDVITNAVPSFLAPSVEGVVSDLPDDFPGRDALIAAGFLTWASLVGKTDDELQALKGIGVVTSHRILEVLNG